MANSKSLTITSGLKERPNTTAASLSSTHNGSRKGNSTWLHFVQFYASITCTINPILFYIYIWYFHFEM